MPEFAIKRVEGILKGSRFGPKEFIRQRRDVLLVSSFIYYKCGTSAMPDETWQNFANDLVILQDSFPELCNQGYYDEAFVDWSGATGMHLPVDSSIVTEAICKYRMSKGEFLDVPAEYANL